MPDLKLRMTYDSIASLYEKGRPSYPDNIIDLIIEFSELKSGQNILDIGCGTGKGILPFLKRGYSAFCIDIGEQMISEAKSMLADFKNVNFEVVKFEDWHTNQKFSLIICASAFHWLEYNKRYLKIAELLNNEGTLAIIKQDSVLEKNEFFYQQEKIYRKHIPEWFESTQIELSKINKLNESGLNLYTLPIKEIFSWKKEYSATEYINLLRTYSGHINLPSEKREKVLNDITKLITNDFNGYTSLKWKTELVLRKKYQDHVSQVEVK